MKVKTRQLQRNSTSRKKKFAQLLKNPITTLFVTYRALESKMCVTSYITEHTHHATKNWIRISEEKRAYLPKSAFTDLIFG